MLPATLLARALPCPTPALPPAATAAASRAASTACAALARRLPPSPAATAAGLARRRQSSVAVAPGPGMGSGRGSGGRGGGLLAAVCAFPRAQPFATNILIATAKTSVADIITQTMIEGRTQIDWRRNFVFLVFGATYLGGFQYWLQVNLFRRMFPGLDRFVSQPFSAKLRDRAGLLDTGKQVVFDVFVHLPFIYLPTFYVVKEFVQGDSWVPRDWVVYGCSKYVANFRKDATAVTSFWFPADLVCFTVPLWLRLPIRHVISLAWTSYLSFLRGSAIRNTPTTTD